MIEVIYKEEKKEAKGREGFFQLPKNIRQIGLLCEHYKIYMEDYVYTFLRKIAEEAVEEGRCALLLGEKNFAEGVTYVFIRCGLLVEGRMTREHLEFSKDIWNRLQEQMKLYFPEQEIVGWFFAQAGMSVTVEETMYRTHVNHFGGDKVLFLMEPQEKEEAFFRYDNGHMCRQPGYYIYYEKNPLMQGYMIALSENQPLESEDQVDDAAVKNFRKIIRDKEKPRKKENQENSMNWIPYAASACLAISVFAVGSNFLGSYDKMKETASQIQEVSLQLDSRKITPEPEEEAGLAVSPSPVPSVSPVITPSPVPEVTPMQEEASVYSTEQTYQVQEGDTLNSIALQFYGSMNWVGQICKKNALSQEDPIYPGQIIVLP